jgi:hypothetical protein
VVGSSIIQRAGEHSKIRPTGTFLGLQQLGCQIVWVGMPGMRWENVVPLIHNLINYRGIPFAVIIHYGGNDIGLVLKNVSRAPCIWLRKMSLAINDKCTPSFLSKAGCLSSKSRCLITYRIIRLFTMLIVMFF